MRTIHRRESDTNASATVSPHLPDEILSEIFSYGPLPIPDDKFSCISSDTLASTFMNFAESSSAYLLVCKTWLRVATPLLYRTVVLRSSAQTQALATALTMNPELGLFIKKLRVEGAFGSPMFDILKAATRITTIYLTISAQYSSEDRDGLIKGLPLINPRRLIVHQALNRGMNAVGKQLREALTQTCIPAWSNLSVVKVTYKGLWTKLAESLREAPNIRTVCIFDENGRLGARNELPPYFATIVQNPAIQEIRIDPPLFSRDNTQIFENNKRFVTLVRDSESRLKTLVQLEAPNTNSHFLYPPQLAADAALEDKIWGLVLRFYFSDPSRNRLVLPPLRVSKTFERLSVPYLYERPVLEKVAEMNSFMLQLRAKPELARHVRDLTLSSKNGRSYRDFAHRLTALKSFSCLLVDKRKEAQMSADDLEMLGMHSGATLQSLEVSTYGTRTLVRPAIFGAFRALTHLRWDSEIVFTFPDLAVYPDVLNQLVSLEVDQYHSSFLGALARMKLPKLKIVSFNCDAIGVSFDPLVRKYGTEFFEAHGGKLVEITASPAQLVDKMAFDILGYCTNIKILGIPCDDLHPLRVGGFDPPHLCPSIERIVVKSSSRHLEKSAASFCAFTNRIADCAEEFFPNLQAPELELSGCQWPTLEHEILQSAMVKQAESLCERGFHLLDTNRVRWRPRLQFKEPEPEQGLIGRVFKFLSRGVRLRN